jgi:hypothetical protein
MILSNGPKEEMSRIDTSGIVSTGAIMANTEMRGERVKGQVIGDPVRLEGATADAKKAIAFGAGSPSPEPTAGHTCCFIDLRPETLNVIGAQQRNWYRLWH